MTEGNFLNILVVGASTFACIYGVITILRALAQRFAPHIDIDAEDVAWILAWGAVLVVIFCAVVIPLGLVLHELFPNATKAILNFWGLK